jgi:hypothetical protein
VALDGQASNRTVILASSLPVSRLDLGKVWDAGHLLYRSEQPTIWKIVGPEKMTDSAHILATIRPSGRAIATDQAVNNDISGCPVVV